MWPLESDNGTWHYVMLYITVKDDKCKDVYCEHGYYCEAATGYCGTYIYMYM